MAGERNKDDIAAALHGLSSNQGSSEPPPAKPAVPKRPTSPVARPASPVAPRSTPAPVAAPEPRTGLTTPARPVAPEALDYRGTQAAAPKAKRRSVSTAGFRRTMIPILLTTGLMLFVMAGARFVVPDDAALAMMPAWGTAVLIVLGVIMITLGLLNMMMVRHEQMQKQQQLQATSGAVASR